jgi:hypothetical protein
MLKIRQISGAFALSVVVGAAMIASSTPAHAAVPEKICAGYQAVYDAAIAAGYTELAGYIKAKAEKHGCSIS